MPETIKGSRILTVARLFFLLVVIPLLLISSLIAFSIVHFGGITKTGTTTALDQKSQQEIKVRANDLAQSIADFLRERQKDIQVVSILPSTVDSYTSFLEAKTQDLWVKKEGQIEKEQLPLYTELSLIDKNGNETIRIAHGKAVAKQDLVNVSNPANTSFKSEDFFLKAKELNKGEVYFSPVTGWYVNKADFEKGKRFEGIIRIATPLFDKQGFSGVVCLALDVRHLMRFTDNIIPTESTYVIKADATTGDYAYMVDSRGYVIAHPNDYHIEGLYKDGAAVPAINASNASEMKSKGEEVLNVKELGVIEPALAEVGKEAAAGKSGIKTYTFEGHNKIAAYAPIPFFTQQFAKPAGFGWVGMAVDIEKFNEQSKLASKKIEKEGQDWLTTMVVILFGAMAILFGIAAILARGINRSIESEAPEAEIKDDED